MITPPGHPPPSALRKLLTHEASGGLILIASAAVALMVANSEAAGLYEATLERKVFGLSVLHWINDALMALFFVLVGLEIKRELLDGQLASWSHRMLPGIAALGGMIAPALVYLAFNTTAATARGWAIPAATDIAFSLGVLALLGSRVPVQIKVLLTALAIIDDLGAIVIIALFYTADLSLLSLGLAAAGLAALLVLNLAGVRRIAPYALVGIFLWVCVLKSGVHATLAGVAIGFAVPLRGGKEGDESPLRHLEHTLHPWVTYGILPVFAFANAGVSLTGLSLSAALLDPVTLGVALGLFFGKQIGVIGTTWLAVRLGIGSTPTGATWFQFYGLALLTGIGFTMSLFIGTLAFQAPEYNDAVRIGVLSGSLVCAVAGYLVLYVAGGRPGTRNVAGRRPG